MTNVGRALFGFIAAAFVVALRTPLSAQLVPIGDEFQINTYTTGSQYNSAIASDAAGNYVVVWGDAKEGDRGGIVARRFDRNGVAIGPEFIVNSYTTSFQYDPDIGMAPDGHFVVVWTSYTDATFLAGTFAQRYDASGARDGTEFQVNTYTTSFQHRPTVAMSGSGNFVIAWENEFDGSYAGIFARRYDSSGAPLSADFLVNTFTPNDQLNPDIEATGSSFVVVWSGYVGDLSNGAVFGRRLDGGGVPIGSEFLVNSYTTDVQVDGRIGANANGDFVVVWASSGQDGSGSGIFGQRYDGTATRVGTEFRVNAYTTGSQTKPVVAVAAPGNFVVTWQGPSPEEHLDGIWARAFSNDGVPDGTDLHVNQFTTGFQRSPRIVATDDRRFELHWESSNQDGDNSGLFGRHLLAAGTPITGRKLFLRSTPATPSANKLTFVSTDAALELPHNVAEDPRCAPVGSGTPSSGARLRVVGDGGSFTIDLPCVNWTANSAGTRYRYRDASGTTCRSIIMRAGRLLKASCKGSQIAYAVAAPAGDIDVVLSTGDPATNNKYCATFGPQSGTTVLRDGSDGRSYSAMNAGLGACP